MKIKQILLVLVASAFMCGLAAAGISKVHQAQVTIKPDPVTGLTREQMNIRDRLFEDNRPGSVKHLYVIAPKSGQVLIYSTVKGKVTSGSKRISPSKTLGPYKCGKDNKDTCYDGFTVQAGNTRVITAEVLGDDGTYGSSAPYIYWWDARGGYHQHFLTEGQIIRISDQPLVVKSVVLNVETSKR